MYQVVHYPWIHDVQYESLPRKYHRWKTLGFVNLGPFAGGCRSQKRDDPASLRQDDLFRQRDDHSRVEAELQLEKGRLRELQEQLGLLKAEYEEKFQTLDSEKAGDEIDIPWIDTSWVIDTQWVMGWRGAIKD